MGTATRVMSLRDGSKKMSKTDDSDYSRINLTDDADLIAQKIRKARTDPLPLPDSEKGFEGRPEADNLVNIYAALSDETREATIARFAGKQFSEFKNALARADGRQAHAHRSRDASPPRRPRRDRPHILRRSGARQEASKRSARRSLPRSNG